MFQNIGTTEIAVVAVIILLLFGGRKLPELGRGLGEAFHELKKAFGDMDDDKDDKKDAKKK